MISLPVIKSASVFRRFIQRDYETRYGKQVEMIPPKRIATLRRETLTHAEDHMKLKRSSKSEGSLSTTTLSSLNVTRKDQMKIKTKFGLLAGCLILDRKST